MSDSRFFTPPGIAIMLSLRSSKLKPGARSIFMELLADSRGDLTIPDEKTPTIMELAERTNQTMRSVLNHLNGLVESGWLIRLKDPKLVKVGRAGNRYKLAIPA